MLNRLNFELMRNVSHLKDENIKINNLIDILSNKNLIIKHPSKPKKLNEYIKDTREKALQRAIFFDHQNNFRGRGFKLIGMELPVIPAEPNKARRRCFDLIWQQIPFDDYQIVEIKYSKNYPSDSPVFALIEALFYKYSILKFHKIFAESKIIRDDGENFWENIKVDNIRVAILANERYWKFWINHKLGFEKLQNIYEKLDDLNIPEFIFIENIDFEIQKKNQLEYIPKLPKACIWNHIKLF